MIVLKLALRRGIGDHLKKGADEAATFYPEQLPLSALLYPDSPSVDKSLAHLHSYVLAYPCHKGKDMREITAESIHLILFVAYFPYPLTLKSFFEYEEQICTYRTINQWCYLMIEYPLPDLNKLICWQNLLSEDKLCLKLDDNRLI